MFRKSHRNPALVPLKCTLPQHNWTILATVSLSFLAGNSREASIHIHYSCLCLCGPLRVWWWLIFHALLFVGPLLRCDPSRPCQGVDFVAGKNRYSNHTHFSHDLLALSHLLENLWQVKFFPLLILQLLVTLFSGVWSIVAFRNTNLVSSTVQWPHRRSNRTHRAPAPPRIWALHETSRTSCRYTTSQFRSSEGSLLWPRHVTRGLFFPVNHVPVDCCHCHCTGSDRFRTKTGKLLAACLAPNMERKIDNHHRDFHNHNHHQQNPQDDDETSLSRRGGFEGGGGGGGSTTWAGSTCNGDAGEQNRTGDENKPTTPLGGFPAEVRKVEAGSGRVVECAVAGILLSVWCVKKWAVAVE